MKIKSKKQNLIKLILFFFVYSFLFTGCETTEIVNESQTITQTYEIEAGSEEELQEKLDNLPDSIEHEGKTYEKEGSKILEEGEEGKDTVTKKTERKVFTNDIILIYKDQILFFLSKYGLLTLAVLAGLFAVYKILKFALSYYDLYW